jgi:hypothetical protein
MAIQLLSLLLRSGVPLEKVLIQLYRTRGQSTIVLDESILTSVAQAIAKTIERAEKHFQGHAGGDIESLGIEEETAEREGSEAAGRQKPRGRICPECGRKTLYPAGGCLTCMTCGFSTCGGTMK